MPIPLSTLIDRLGGTCRGDDRVLVRVAEVASAGAADLVLVGDKKYLETLARSAAGAVLLPPALYETAAALPTPAESLPAGGPARSFWLHEKPRRAWVEAISILHPPHRPAPGIHPTAVVAADAQLSPDVHLGPWVTVGAGAQLGAGVVLEAGCHIGAGVTLGSQVWCQPHGVVYADCQIGERTIIHSGAVIGADGFGNEWDGTRWHKIPQLGRVLIGNDVEIGANTTIDRGALGDTVIGDGVRIDNLVQIAHNVQIGAHTAIAACTGIAGSTHIGRHCILGGATMLTGHITLVDGVTILGGTAVIQSITEAGVYGGPHPVQPQKDWQRNAVHLRRLDATLRALRRRES